MSAIIADYTAASNLVSVDFGTWDPGYKAIDIIMFISYPGAGFNANYNLYINQDYTANHYYTQSTIGSDANVTGAETNNAEIAYASPANAFCARFLIMTGPAACLWTGYVVRYDSDASLDIIHRTVHYADSNPPHITDIRLDNQWAGIGTGSRILIRDQST